MKTTMKDLQTRIEELEEIIKNKTSGDIKIKFPASKRLEIGLELARAISLVARISLNNKEEPAVNISNSVLTGTVEITSEKESENIQEDGQDWEDGF